MWIDITLLVIVVLGIIKGWQQGFVISIFMAAAWLLGVMGALKFCSVVAAQLHDRLEWNAGYVAAISFILIFVVIVFVIYLLGKSLEKVIEVAQLGTINKLLGVVLRIAVYALVFSFFVWLLNEAGLVADQTKSASKSYFLLDALSSGAIHFFNEYLPFIQKIFHDLEKFFEDLATKAEKAI